MGMTVLQGGMFEEEVSEAGESVFVRPDTGLWLMVDGSIRSFAFLEPVRPSWGQSPKSPKPLRICCH